MNEMEMSPRPDRPEPPTDPQEPPRPRGKLTVFLGYAAGVGKTHAMLDAARQRLAEGTKVIVGYVETHGQAEPEALLAGLETVPPKRINDKAGSFLEIDTETIAARHPQLVLVDELAHDNAPGACHLKRYQDVEELLEYGIDVYGTLNVQHLESLKDIIAQITGITVADTIPDRILDEADEIKVVDLPTEELLRRIQDGKVYLPDRAARTVQAFFRPGNLAALRQLTLRRVAERVDEQMRAYMQTRAIPGPWAAGERLLVCVGPGPAGEQLVRAGRRLAAGMDAEWFVLHVETPEEGTLHEAARDRLADTLHLAEELGAKATTLPGNDVADHVLQYAQAHNITKIVLGKPVRPRWASLLRPSLVDHIIQESGTVDVHLVGTSGEYTRPPRRPLQIAGAAWSSYFAGLAIVVAVTFAGGLIRRLIVPSNLVMLYLLAVVIAALRWGLGPSILTALLGGLAFDFFFIPPHLTFAVADTQYLLTFVALIVVGLVISSLAAREKGQAEEAQHRELQTATLYNLSRDLAAAVGLDAIVQAVIAHVVQTFTREAAVLLPQGENVAPCSQSPGFTMNEDDRAAATWAYRHGQAAGRGTGTLPAAGARYLPLVTARGAVGVLGVRPASADLLLTPDQRRLLEAFASQAAVAIERAQLADEARKAQLLQETEKLQTALLNSISHDLRTPLASITGALSSLQDDEVRLDEGTRNNLVETAREEAERLNRLVRNLLDMTRIEGGAMRVAPQPCDVEELIGAALGQLAGRLGDRPLTVDVPPGLPPVPADFVLMTQVLVNLIDNALKYSPPETPVEISARQQGQELSLAVADRGIGIPPEDLSRVFDKFYRVQRPHSIGGTGLGLAISKGMVEAQGGRIWAENRPEGGTVARLALPLEPCKAMERIP